MGWGRTKMWGQAARASSDITLPTLGQCPAQVGIITCPPLVPNHHPAHSPGRREEMPGLDPTRTGAHLLLLCVQPCPHWVCLLLTLPRTSDDDASGPGDFCVLFCGKGSLSTQSLGTRVNTPGEDRGGQGCPSLRVRKKQTPSWTGV